MGERLLLWDANMSLNKHAELESFQSNNDLTRLCTQEQTQELSSKFEGSWVIDHVRLDENLKLKVINHAIYKHKLLNSDHKTTSVELDVEFLRNSNQMEEATKRMLNCNNPRAVERHMKKLEEMIIKEDLEKKLEDENEDPDIIHQKLMQLMKMAEKKLKSRFNLNCWFPKSFIKAVPLECKQFLPLD